VGCEHYSWESYKNLEWLIVLVLSACSSCPEVGAVKCGCTVPTDLESQESQGIKEVRESQGNEKVNESQGAEDARESQGIEVSESQGIQEVSESQRIEEVRESQGILLVVRENSMYYPIEQLWL